MMKWKQRNQTERSAGRNLINENNYQGIIVGLIIGYTIVITLLLKIYA